MFEIAPGRYEVDISLDGFEEVRDVVVVSADETAVSNPELLRIAGGLSNVVVTASRYELFEANASGGSLYSLDRSDVEQQPNLGEDAVRPVNRLPGVATTGLSARSFIRGGQQDELLISFDGLRLYEPFHLKDYQSIFSIIDPNTVETMEVFTGGFTAAHGDAMSSILNITPRQSWGREAVIGASFFNLFGMSSGTIDSDRGSWVAALRRGNLSWLIDTVDPDVGSPEYFDVLGRVSYDVNDSMTMSVNTMHSQDKIIVSNSDDSEQSWSSYKNSYLWLTLENRWSVIVSVVRLCWATPTSTIYGRGVSTSC